MFFKKSKNKWADSFSKLAKEKGYPARSIFKLEEIQKSYRILKRGDKVLDLGASPGSWSLFALKIVGKEGKVVAIDLTDLKIPIFENIEFLKGDIFEDNIFSNFNQKFDVILSDLAPKTTGFLDLDKDNSFELSKRAFEIAKKFLKKGGNFVCKILESENTKEFFKEVKNYFNFVKRFRPQATRKQSSEIYIIAKDYKF
jgi:23S rRNA (uridine2552-2'-O)-methyltransferase